jgi:hypothetical protein
MLKMMISQKYKFIPINRGLWPHQHLDLWDVRPKPPPRANDPPTEAIIIYDEFTSPSADDYIIDVDSKARFRYLEGYCLG